MTGAVAAPLPLANVDTDKIVPGRFLKTVSRTGLGKALFHALRYDDAGEPRPDFVLNRAPWRQAGILIAGDNFGCGSSREHAPWALADFGIRAIVAPSFADIFRANCIKNGILPIVLSAVPVKRLMALAGDPDTAFLRIDLPGQTLFAGDESFAFAIDAGSKQMLIEGRDELTTSLGHLPAIAAFERRIAYPVPSATR